MASAAPASGWLRGKVKAVPSGDSLLIMGSAKTELPPEKTITLASIIAPKLARRGTEDEPFAWQSREFLRKLCIGKEVTFRVDYTVPTINREFGSVFIGDKNVAYMVVAEGWAKVREAGPQKAEVSPYIAELRRLEEQAKTQGLGRWTKTPGASGESMRDLPPSAIGDPSNFDAMALLATNKGKPMEAFVEHVRDGSTLRVYLLPEFNFVQVFMAGIQSPSMGRRAAVPDVTASSDVVSDEANAEVEVTTSLTTAQRIAASASTAAAAEVPPDPYAREAKHFTELRVLNRDVRIVLEGVDKFSNLIGSVHYPDGDVAKDLALELVENGLAKVVEWSASMMEEDSKRRLKTAELQAKKDRLRIWTNYVPPASNSKAIRDDKFTGKVVEVVSGDCIVVADDAAPYGSPLAERRVNLSSIRSPKMGRKDEKPAPYAREAKEYLRTRLIGKQVYVTMEYSRKVAVTDGPAPSPAPSAVSDLRVMDFGSVFLVSPSKGELEDVAPTMSASNQPEGINVGEMIVARGFGTVIRHRDFEERSNFYDALLAAESRALHGKKGIHSARDPPVMHIQDLSTASAKKTKDFLPFLQRTRRLSAIVDFVLNGHRFKLIIPKETCTIAFSFAGVRCPGRGEQFADEAVAFMRRKILQRDVEVEVETVDRVGTYLGSLWESKTNMAVALLEAGLAKLHPSFSVERTVDGHLLAQAEENARKQRLKVWENYVEGQEATNGSAPDSTSKKEVLKVHVTDVLDGGKFYVQVAGDSRVSSIQQQLSTLALQEKPPVVGFNPNKGDIVLAQFSADGSWNRAMVVNAPRGGGIASPKDQFEVFYIDYGNQEIVPYGKMRPLDASVSSAPGLAKLCSLAYIKVPGLEEDFGHEAGEYFSECTLKTSKELVAMVEERDTSGGKVKGKGTGPVLVVTLVDAEAGSSINAAMLQEGLARLERKKRWDTKERQLALDNLEEHQEKAKQARLNMWQYGDVDSDEEDAPAARKGGRR
ncbi:hypothetical protein KI387_000448 [Taxus chinensis]|uniref:Ribonuclease n=2 Tax=Taxus chinensis TaxID=29808 RepID=A0AA38LN29_TAXCH|nr:hypothetical protein KI387_000448 [Taxus chinensis]